MMDDPQKRILIVDDDPNILRSYARTLRMQFPAWDIAFDHCPKAAWRRLQIESFDTIVCDMRMPGMTGLQLLELIKSNETTADIPVVIVTGDADHDLKRRALDMDATDLLNKPVDANDLMARIKSALRMKACSDELKLQNELLEDRVRQRTAELAASRQDVIWRLGKAAEYRDEETGNHVIRVACYSRLIARELGMDDRFCETIFLAAPLHDIGKIGIPDDVLLKPGKLTSEEWAVMTQHCEIGAAILTNDCKLRRVAVTQLGSGIASNNTGGELECEVMEMAETIAVSHHERWDGHGYPHQLAGTSIPIAARIVAVADVYDALRSQRPYKTPLSAEQSLAILKRDCGKHFDLQVVEAFLNAFDKVTEIEAAFRDEFAAAG